MELQEVIIELKLVIMEQPLCYGIPKYTLESIHGLQGQGGFIYTVTCLEAKIIFSRGDALVLK
jgi:hypothetical protein